MYSYWHVVPAVGSGERVTAYETVVGHVQRPWGHVHFSEIRGGRFENPLRPGAMGPYSDHTAPELTEVTLEHDARPVPFDYPARLVRNFENHPSATCSLRFEP